MRFDSRGNERRYDLPDVAAMSGMVIWQAPGGLRYGYRVHGPWQPAQGHRFNPASYCLTLMRAGSRAN